MSGVNEKAFFSKHLAVWFHQVDWHYVTLLSVAIECVNELPDDCDTLLSGMLIRYPIKPSESVIAAYLQSSVQLAEWFKRGTLSPKIIRFNLDTNACIKPENSLHPGIDTLGDLADWLELPKPQLDWYANLWRFDAKTPEHLKHYQYQFLEKRDGSTRLIEKPKSTLKRIQRKINNEILSTLAIHTAAHGFCKNRNCLSHASLHTGRRYVLQYDIAECFQSINWLMVKGVFKRLDYSASVCAHLTALCTHRVHLPLAQLRQFNSEQRDRLQQRHLPQGAPSSPALANAVLHQLDVRLSGLASHYGLSYSRYADDIALSGNRERDWRFLEPLIGAICLEEGLTLNYKKTRIKRPHQKQRITGIVVNSKANVDRKYFDNLKAILTNCSRHGIDSQNRFEHPNFRSHLLGRIQYVKSLNQKKGLKLENIYSNIKS